ncbi:hypothetical protein P7C70_g6073, partial [Phenoliferia sp. Uapishka_3]
MPPKILSIQTIPMSREAMERNPLLVEMMAKADKGGRATASVAQNKEAEKLELRTLESPREAALEEALKLFARAAAQEMYAALSSAMEALSPNPIHTTHTLLICVTWHPEIKDPTLAFTLDLGAPMLHDDVEEALGEKGVGLRGMLTQDALNNVHGMKLARPELLRSLTIWWCNLAGNVTCRMMPMGIEQLPELKRNSVSRKALEARRDPLWFPHLQERLKYSGMVLPGSKASPRDLQRFSGVRFSVFC